MNTWPAPEENTMCPIRLPRCFSSSDMESPTYNTTWTAPNETALSYTTLLLGRMLNDHVTHIVVDIDWQDLTIKAYRR
jgi:hypothetical protein